MILKVQRGFTANESGIFTSPSITATSPPALGKIQNHASEVVPRVEKAGTWDSKAQRIACHTVATVQEDHTCVHQAPEQRSLHQCTQSFGWRSTSRISASLEFSGGECMYSHRAVRGKDIKMLSILDPGVKRPNLVPRSYNRLNSTYRPLLSCCHSLSWGVNESSQCFFTMGT